MAEIGGTGLQAPITSTLSAREVDDSGLILTATCTGTPPTTVGIFSHGAQITQTDTASGSPSLYENTGTTAAPVWNLVGSVTPGEITLAEGNILVGNSSGVAASLSAKTTTQILIGNGTTLVSAALSGDATMSNAGVVTVSGATGAFNVGTNQTWAKEVNHTSTVTATTTAATVGGSLAFASGAGNTSGAGGAISVTAGAGGTSGAGGAASLVGGAGGGGNTNGGAVSVTGGANAGNAIGGAVTITGGSGGSLGTGGGVTITGGVAGSTPGAVSMTGGAANLGNGTGGSSSLVGGSGIGTGAGGAVLLTSGAAANGAGVNPGASGAITLTVGNAGTATTGVGGAGGAISITGASGGNSTGASSVAGAGSSISIAAGTGGSSSGGGDTGGAGGSVVITAANGGTGATVGRNGIIFNRSVLARKFTVTAKTTAVTLTPTEVLGGMITANLGGAAPGNYTLPLGTDLAAALPSGFTVGDAIDFTVTNISTNASEDVTVVGNTGTTLIGGGVVNSNDSGTSISCGTFRFVNSGAGTFNVYRIA